MTNSGLNYETNACVLSPDMCGKSVSEKRPSVGFQHYLMLYCFSIRNNNLEKRPISTFILWSTRQMSELKVRYLIYITVIIPFCPV